MKNNFTDSKEDLCEIRDATVTRRTGLLDSLDLKHELKEALDEKKQFQKAFKQHLGGQYHSASKKHHCFNQYRPHGTLVCVFASVFSGYTSFVTIHRKLDV